MKPGSFGRDTLARPGRNQVGWDSVPPRSGPSPNPGNCTLDCSRPTVNKVGWVGVPGPRQRREGKGRVTNTKTKRAAVVRADPERSLRLALAAARTAAENRGRDVTVLDLRDLTAIVDYFVIATGTSRRQLHAISEEVDRVLQEELGDQRLGIEGYAESRWIVLDYGTVMIHLFDDETRGYYDLENLWAEAKRVDLTSTLAGIR